MGSKWKNPGGREKTKKEGKTRKRKSLNDAKKNFPGTSGGEKQKGLKQKGEKVEFQL